MQQRVVIAMALAKDPTLLILDEPTTGLDATVEAEVLDLVAQLRAEFGTACCSSATTSASSRKMCDRVGVLYAGKLVEEGPTTTVFNDPRHPYTVGLLRCMPRGGARKDHGRLDTIPGFLPQLGADLPGCVFADRCALADGRLPHRGAAALRRRRRRHSRCHFHEQAQRAAARDAADAGSPPRRPRRRRRSCASRSCARCSARHGHDDARVDGRHARRSGRARRSGSSASRAAARRRSRGLLLGLVRADEGSGVELDGKPLAADARQARRERGRARCRSSSRIPTRRSTAATRCGASSRRALKKLAGAERRGSARRALTSSTHSVRLAERYLSARPRAALGRAEAARGDRARVRRRPALVVCDEPTSALDVSVQAAILNLLAELQAREEGRLPLHLARPRRRALPLRPDRRALPRAADGARAGRASSSTGRTIRTRRRCSRRCPRSTASGASASGSRARSRAPPIRRRAACSTRAARASSATICEQQEPPLVEVEAGPPHALPHPDRGAAGAARRAQPRGRRRRREDPRGRPRARRAGRWTVDELELAPPGPGEVLVRLHASGVCHSD